MTVLPFSTASGVGFQFLFDVTSSAFQLNELLFGYFASATGFTNVTLAMPGATATGDGVVTAVQDVLTRGQGYGAALPATLGLLAFAAVLSLISARLFRWDNA